jgi:hypothetical protein
LVIRTPGEHRHEHVQVVDHLVAVGEHGAGDALATGDVGERAEHEPARVGRVGQVPDEPVVDVGVVQVGALGPQPLEVLGGDAELGGHLVVGVRGGPVAADAGSDAGVGEVLLGVGDVPHAVDRGDPPGAGHEVVHGAALLAEQGDEVAEFGVAGVVGAGCGGGRHVIRSWDPGGPAARRSMPVCAPGAHCARKIFAVNPALPVDPLLSRPQ